MVVAVTVSGNSKRISQVFSKTQKKIPESLHCVSTYQPERRDMCEHIMSFNVVDFAVGRISKTRKL